MKWFDEVSEIARIMNEKWGPLDQSALKVSTNHQAPADSINLVLRHRGTVLLMMSGVEKITVPVSHIRGETLPETFDPSSLLEIQFVPSRPGAS